MINTYDILETIRMIQDECLDIRTTTTGCSFGQGTHRKRTGSGHFPFRLCRYGY